MNRRGFLGLLGAAVLGRKTKLLRVAPHRAPVTGMSIRIVRTYDPFSHIGFTRMDVLYGFAPNRPEHAVRLAS